MAKDAVSVFKELSRYREINKAVISSVSEDAVVVDSSWSQRLLVKCEAQNLWKTYTLKPDNFKTLATSGPFFSEDCLWKVPSPSGKYYLYIRKPTSNGTNSKVDVSYVEVWTKDGCCERAIDVAACEKHGAIYDNDGAFGTVQWNRTEDKVLYVAEKKLPKSSSYFSESWKKDDTANVEPRGQGEKFVYKEDWGEQLVGKFHPIVCILDLPTGLVTTIEHGFEDLSCGHATFTPDGKGVVLCAYNNTPVKLAVVHCPIRRSTLFHVDLETTQIRQLSENEETSVRHPRFSPDGKKLIYLQCRSGGPHARCFKLQMIEWETNIQNTIVDIVHSSSSKENFHGIYNPDLANRCWSEDSTHVFLSSPARSRKDIFTVDVSTRQVRRLTEEAGTWSVLDVCGNIVLAAYSSLNIAPRLAVGKISGVNGSRCVKWVYLDEDTSISGISWKTIEHYPRIPHPDYPNLTFESLLMIPTEHKSRALIVFPHGGPHSSFSIGYQIYFAGLAKAGFTVALINYRGSTGFGDDNIHSLLGHIGDHDVKDVQQAAEDIVEEFNMDREKIVALGGSHGGYLVAQLIGQYPNFYKAAVMRNPVTNMVAMVTQSDIPDWNHVESGFPDYVPGTVPSEEIYSKLYKLSPVAHLHKVVTPTMIMLGEEDRRVPPCLGIEYHKALISKGVKSKLMIYPGNSHPIKTVEAESDSFVQLFLWFTQHL